MQKSMFLFSLHRRLFPFLVMAMSVVQNGDPSGQLGTVAGKIVTGTAVAAGGVGLFAIIRGCGRTAFKASTQAAKAVPPLFGKRGSLFPPGMIPTQPATKTAAVREAIKNEGVLLYDAAGKPIVKNSTLWSSAEAEYRYNAHRIFKQVLDEIPVSKIENPALVKTALEKAFKSSPKGKYNFDVSTGKLKISYTTKHGEITGEINAYKILKRVVTAGAGYYSFQSYLTKDMPTTTDSTGDLNNIGSVYFQQGKYEEALKHYQGALAIHKETENLLSRANTLGNIGLVYFNQGKYEEALKSHQDALAIHKETENLLGQAGDLNNIGLVYFNQGKHEEALKLLNGASSIFSQIGATGKSQLVERTILQLETAMK